jgi:uncharacterized protein YdhG (YjbR/CyaY superfamily)
MEILSMAFTTIKEYTDNLTEQGKAAINDFIDFMKEEYPAFLPKISYGMPMWWIGTKIYNGYVAVSAAKKHYSTHFLDEEYLTKLSAILPNCTFGKRCVNIKYGDNESDALVKQGVREYFGSIM